MPGLHGRGASVVRTPALVRQYLAGQAEWPGDTPGEPERRVSAGDCVARIHQRTKGFVKATAKPKGGSYQWPRRHSFSALIHHLITLGLLEPTGQIADPVDRGAGQLGTARDFNQRVWVRLTTGSADRVEWLDPIGYLAQTYPSMRLLVRPLPTELVAVAPAPRRRRRRAEAAEPTPEVSALEARVKHLENLRGATRICGLTNSRSMSTGWTSEPPRTTKGPRG